MPTRKPRTPSYRLHKPTGQAVVTFDGRDHYLGRFNTEASREAYDRLIAEWLARGRTAVPSDTDQTPTVIELSAAYWKFAEEFYQKNGQPTGELGKVKVALKPLKRLYGRTECSRFGPLALKAVRNEFLASGIGRRAINDQIGRLKRMFRWGVENELIPPSTFHGLQAVAGLRQGKSTAPEPKPVRPVPDEYVDGLKAYGKRELLPELDGIEWSARDVVVCFDSDAATTFAFEHAS